ncbi:exodeoxyribonuclease III [Sinisalibacter aestuarii]|uniref:Exodeoxyribonuclease III n=1 Tax=Sinisalibacter aestuarii TaxID=2949426 RepID=A0ABQ5LT96_9RHOB|nr:exodeoxyribonuclease III [Sinisalibacter aestuarii]GKY87546.1 exodeoxyribonuclease III [Sinisalibacter aestuarii]
MKIASFNINGIKARLPVVLDWLKEAEPDVAILQEIKTVDEGFPREPFEDLGYNVETHGQKSFNGVALLSRLPLEDVVRGLPGAEGAGREGVDDEEARYIEATVVGEKAVRICGLYLPNGNPAPGEKYDYKLKWIERLSARAEELLRLEEPFLMAGDYNVIPQAEDAARPQDWVTDALFLPETRAAFRRLVHLGLTEALRARTRAHELYTFWDFQRGAWQRNDGIRIDHFLLSPQCADLLEDCQIDKDLRARDKPSDHVPIWVKLAA